MYFVKKINSFPKLIAFIALFIVLSCKKNHHDLSPVNYAQFETFVKQTDYKTDAEKYG